MHEDPTRFGRGLLIGLVLAALLWAAIGWALWAWLT
jgi:hypothetical protein